jgi:hypothetical protein
MRYADVLLMLAECEVELDNLNKARELINRIRERAEKCVQGPGDDIESITVDINDPKLTWAKYQIGTYDDPWIDKDLARKAVRFERRLELAMEGHRLFDLRRWRIAKEVISKYLEVEKEKREYLRLSDDFEDKHYLYPIPQMQRDLSEIDGVPQLDQNEGY